MIKRYIFRVFCYLSTHLFSLYHKSECWEDKFKLPSLILSNNSISCPLRLRSTAAATHVLKVGFALGTEGVFLDPWGFLCLLLRLKEGESSGASVEGCRALGVAGSFPFLGLLGRRLFLGVSCLGVWRNMSGDLSSTAATAGLLGGWEGVVGCCWNHQVIFCFGPICLLGLATFLFCLLSSKGVFRGDDN